MTAIQKIEELNKIDQNEFDNLIKIVFESFRINRQYKSISFLSKKEELIDYFSTFIEKYLELQFIKNKDQKLELINFIDKLNMQRELLELAKVKTNITDITVAANRLGKKSQSAFKQK